MVIYSPFPQIIVWVSSIYVFVSGFANASGTALTVILILSGVAGTFVSLLQAENARTAKHTGTKFFKKVFMVTSKLILAVVINVFITILATTTLSITGLAEIFLKIDYEELGLGGRIEKFFCHNVMVC